MAKPTRRAARGNMFWRALVVFVAIVVAATTVGTPAQAAQPGYKTVINIHFYIMDYESFGENERCSYDIPLVETRNSGFWYFGKCGGEVRAEIHYTLTHHGPGSLNPDSVTVSNGEVKLFEGSSANTSDLDGRITFAAFTVLRDQQVSKKFHVWNSDEQEPDDMADVTFTVGSFFRS